MASGSNLLQFKALVDDGQSEKGFLRNNQDAYASPSFLNASKLSSLSALDKWEFFDECLIKLQRDDPTLISIDVECRSIGDYEMTHFRDALAINSTLLELSIRHGKFNAVVATRLVEALKINFPADETQPEGESD